MIYPTFKAAATARGLILDDLERQRALEEASSFQMPYQLRQLFAYMYISESIKCLEFMEYIQRGNV